ncbi:MAG: carbohydrate-binding domain-containing protein [Arthrobacter sp.]|nr:carbohydrate-binding domain-containing protein [Arthrobacter sp.]
MNQPISPQPSRRLSALARRRILAPAVLAVALVSGLSACGSASDTSAAGSSGAASLSTTATATETDSSATGEETSSTGSDADLATLLASVSAASAQASPTATTSALDALAGNGEIKDVEADTSGSTTITLDSTTATVDGEGASVSGSTVTITAGGSYRISGTLSDGKLVVNAADDTPVTLILDGVEISTSSGAAIEAQDAKALALVLAEGSENSLSSSAAADEEADVNAALWADDELSISGTGSLNVSAEHLKGIASQDGLVMTGGTVTVTAGDDGVRGKDYAVLAGGSLSVNAQKDGIVSNNEDDATLGFVWIAGGTLQVTSGGDGIQAETDLALTGGSVSVVAGGGSEQKPSDDTSSKALKAGAYLAVEGGTLNADSADDALHSNGVLRVAGGTTTASSGDDGAHADTALLVADGTLTIERSEEGLESASLTVAGGTTSVTSNDDGLNASAGSTSASGDTEGNDQQAAVPQGQGGGMDADDGSELLISGGTLTVRADGDGIDSNGTASITGGSIAVYGPTSGGNGSLDVNGEFTISGGTLVTAGASGMMVTPDADSKQSFVAITTQSSFAEGDTLTLQDADGTTVATITPQTQGAAVIYSSDQIEDGATYTLVKDGQSIGTGTAGEEVTSMGGRP